jgi:hypothetical protein
LRVSSSEEIDGFSERQIAGVGDEIDRAAALVAAAATPRFLFDVDPELVVAAASGTLADSFVRLSASEARPEALGRRH